MSHANEIQPSYIPRSRARVGRSGREIRGRPIVAGSRRRRVDRRSRADERQWLRCCVAPPGLPVQPQTARTRGSSLSHSTARSPSEQLKRCDLLNRKQINATTTFGKHRTLAGSCCLYGFTVYDDVPSENPSMSEDTPVNNYIGDRASDIKDITTNRLQNRAKSSATHRTGKNGLRGHFFSENHVYRQKYRGRVELWKAEPTVPA